MRQSVVDTVDYVVTVAVMNWTVNALWHAQDIQTVVAQADHTGQGICRHFAAGQEAVNAGEAGHLHYRWSPVYEVIIEPEVNLILDTDSDNPGRAGAKQRLLQLGRCLSYLQVVCERSPEWEGSGTERFMTKIHDTLAPILARAGAEKELSTEHSAWHRDHVSPVKTIEAVGEDRAGRG